MYKRGTYEVFDEFLNTYSVSRTSFEMVCDKQRRINETPMPETLEDSRQYQQKVKEYNNAMTAMLKSAPNLAGLTADLEKLMRSLIGGGSVSKSLFGGETLTVVHQAYGTKAKNRIVIFIGNWTLTARIKE